MLKIVGKNETVQNLIELFSPEFTNKFVEFVRYNDIVKSFRFPAPINVKKFIFFYDFFDEESLIVVKAFAIKNNDKVFHCDNQKDADFVKEIYNDYMDNEKFID